MHGKLSRIRHDGRGCFKNIPQGFLSTRYHSLSASVKTLPDVMAITAVTEESGVIMGVRHRTYTLEAVQYHPESVLSESGDDLLKNFLELRGGTWEENPSSRVLDLALPPFPIDAPNGKPPPKASNKLPTILEKIHVQRLKDIDVAKNTPGTTPADIDTLLSLNLAPTLIPLVARMRTTPDTAPALMAEIKRASPSKGPIAMTTNAAQQALTYALSGASVISVLTEPTWFKGSLLDMRLARQAIDALPNRPAILRKDFIVDEYQIVEARLHGADTVLLIVAMLPVQRLKALYEYATKLGMEPLVEVNNAAEMEHALALGAKVIGVNNRNLHNFEVDMGTTSRLVDMVKERDVILCALSGISTNDDVKMYVDQGVHAVLVGESLMRAQDTSVFIRQLLGWPEVPKETEEESNWPLVKICGIRSVEEATAATEAGADLLGLMFVPASKRHVALEEAIRIVHSVRSLRSNVSTSSTLDTLTSLSKTSYTDEQLKNTPWFTTHAQRLSSTLSPHHSRPLLVGVFQNQPLDFILKTVSAVQLDIVQLHGTEPLHWAQHIPVPVIRVFHVNGEGDRGITGITRPGMHQFVLLDSATAKGGLSGGSGITVDWDLASEVVEKGEVPSSTSSTAKDVQSTNGSAIGTVASTGLPAPSSSSYPMPIILAGGLTPENVSDAVRKVRPWAVDVSGGVERSDGQGKDPEKVAAFVRAAKGWPPQIPPSPGVGDGEGLSVDVDVEASAKGNAHPVEDDDETGTSAKPVS
jgi:anthranilate synthase/indole-3-glycerol phosphate synthase/phosphoribosylanthranilate isomerase